MLAVQNRSQPIFEDTLSEDIREVNAPKLFSKETNQKKTNFKKIASAVGVFLIVVAFLAGVIFIARAAEIKNPGKPTSLAEAGANNQASQKEAAANPNSAPDQDKKKEKRGNNQDLSTDSGDGGRDPPSNGQIEQMLRRNRESDVGFKPIIVKDQSTASDSRSTRGGDGNPGSVENFTEYDEEEREFVNKGMEHKVAQIGSTQP